MSDIVEVAAAVPVTAVEEIGAVISDTPGAEVVADTPAPKVKTHRPRKAATDKTDKRETNLGSPAPQPSSSPPRRRSSTRGGSGGGRHDLAEFRAWLANLDPTIAPSLHINGPAYQNAVLVVDFGQPLKPLRLTTEQSSELVTRIREAVRLLVGRETSPVRVHTDSQTGVWHASLS